PDIVVNNAGFGLLGPAASLSRAEQLAMVDVNVRALTDVSLAFVDSLERHKGGILNIASIAAFSPGPNMAAYHATKAYVLSFSEGLHWELRWRGIRVTALCPGPVPTEFQVRAGYTSDSDPDMLKRTADRVAQDGYRALQQGRRVAVPGALNRLTAAVTRMLPRRFLTEAVGRYNNKRIPK
ncbi:MAG: SDR family NAD(P)-dependent oxidoreductase, partial [Rhizobiales bacterium]|nr:SDR family NAD(P)-dependent oxidoreductase [Hyphomicrobiales bacterium]